MAKTLKVDSGALDILDGAGDQVKQTKKKQREDQQKEYDKHKTFKKFTKPVGDYYRLDMVVRETVPGRGKQQVITEDIKVDYKDYVDTMAKAEGLNSITKYIHRLLDEDMAKNGKRYKQIKKSMKG